MRRDKTRIAGNTLAASLITVAIILVLVVLMIKGPGMFGLQAGSPRPDHKGTTVLGQVRYAAEDTVCQSDLAQLRQSIQIYQQTNDKYPDTLQDTKLGAEFYQCPLGHEPYQYDPQTGQVRCVHPGHERY
jgi:hypothetical protein